MPSALNPPSGCRFHTRCPYVIDRCRIEVPQLCRREPDMPPPATAPAELPPADAIVPADGALSPALESLVAAFSRMRKGRPIRGW